jgi:hypothetical protein
MKLKSFVLLSTALLFSQQASAVGKDKADRWFEMEVILFSQLGDKTKLKEQFPENNANSTNSNNRKIFDLLGPYLAPDISSLKQQLPDCALPTYPESFLNQAITAVKEQPFFEPKSLTDFEVELNAINNDESANSSLFSDSTDSIVTNINSGQSTEQITSSQQADSEDDFYNNNSLVIENKANRKTENNIDLKQPVLLTAEQVEQQSQLLAQAENEFSKIQFSYANEIASFSRYICSIPIEQFIDLNSDNTYESYTAFNIDKVPSIIDNSEDIYSDQDYILSKESLQLNDIVKQLARSKNFRPLLHMGWRQKTKTKRLAIPMKLYAGENFAYNYQQELQKYQRQLMQAQIQENSLNQILFENKTDGEASTFEAPSEYELKQQNINERIQELILKVPSISTDTINVLKEVDNDIAITKTLLHSTAVLKAPVKPPQDWTVDGLLKIEVDHFLHITADLNIMNMSLAELATQQLLPKSFDSKAVTLKTINFKQDRRVRSKEVHYFDHPYIGMIIRILPYKKPIKEVEDSTSIN